MSLAIAVLLSGSCAYALLMLAFARGLRREVRATMRREATDDAPRPFVSVLIPARNEAASIAACLRSLRATTYPDDRYEIIVIDDGSTDSTVERVRRFQQRHRPVAAEEQTLPAEAPCLRLVQREGSPGSKHGALLDGLQAARGELILTTDADCVVPPGWMSAMVNRFD
ncbi:MAG: glycosyltransferase, partial [Bacteroidetes bacterium]|nr:glycosyltransferase [Bacteroidota bacterium]